MTRQWLANPENMCQQHLNGEHAETHMFLTKMHRGNSLDGFIEGSMFFGAEFVQARHDLLAGYLPGHSTPLYVDPRLVTQYPLILPTIEDIKKSLSDLLNRCEWCAARHGVTPKSLQIA